MFAFFVFLCKSLKYIFALYKLKHPRTKTNDELFGGGGGGGGDISESSHTSDLKTGTPVATLPGAWRYKGQRWDWSSQCQYTVTR